MKNPILMVLFFSSIFLGAALLLISCDGESDDDQGGDKGWTNDVGDSCGGFCKDDLWCFDSNMALCVSTHCVGRSIGDMYCTQLCETPDACPDGFTCTIDCELDSSGQPYCVNDEDYDWLVSISKCG